MSTDEQELIDNSPKCLEKIASLFDDPELSDITLRIGTESFNVHRLVLAKSSDVFKVLLTSENFRESNKDEITLSEKPECVPLFGDFLRYIYTGRIVMTVEKAVPILVLSDKYQVLELKQCCTDFMLEKVNTGLASDCIVSWYQYAKAYKYEQLYARCFDFIVWNMDTIVASPEWLDLEHDSLIELLQRSDMIVVDEHTLFRAVCAWLQEHSSVAGGGHSDFRLSNLDNMRRDGDSQLSTVEASNVTDITRPAEDEQKRAGEPSGGDRVTDADDLVSKNTLTNPVEGNSDHASPRSHAHHDNSQHDTDPTMTSLLDTTLLEQIRFPLITSDKFSALEQEPLVSANRALFAPYLLSMYKYNATPREYRQGDDWRTLLAAYTTFRNYKKDSRIEFCLAINNFAGVAYYSKFDYKVTTHRSGSNADVSGKCHWEIQFFPKGYQTIASYPHKNVNSVKMVLYALQIPATTEIPCSVEIYVRRRCSTTTFFTCAVAQEYVFSQKCSTLILENIVDYAEITRKGSSYVIDNALILYVFIKPKPG